MTDHIDRGALKEYLYGGKFQEGCAGCDEPGEGCIECIVDEIDNFPAADVAPVRRGHWIKRGYACGEAEFECSHCHEIEWRANETDYCPNCGAKMEVDYKN